MAYEKTTEELTKALNERIDQYETELTTLRAITVNTSHKQLTNRAITGDATISTRSYSLNGSKELSYSYRPKTGGYQRDSIDLSEFTGETVGFVKQQRTITPAQLVERINERIAYREKELDALHADLEHADEYVAEYNRIIADIATLEGRMTWASRAVLRVR